MFIKVKFKMNISLVTETAYHFIYEAETDAALTMIPRAQTKDIVVVDRFLILNHIYACPLQLFHTLLKYYIENIVDLTTDRQLWPEGE